MKVGDKVPVQIGAHTVAQAEVKELGDGTATLVVPATLVVMGTRTTLDDLPTGPTGDTETLITGVDRASKEPVESTTGNEPNQNNGGSEQPSTTTADATAATVGASDSGGVVETSPVQPVADGGTSVDDSGTSSAATPSANAPADNPATTVTPPSEA